jgi:heme/copper-type cytochrome/quinol oxidase subunit 4
LKIEQTHLNHQEIQKYIVVFILAIPVTVLASIPSVFILAIPVTVLASIPSRILIQLWLLLISEQLTGMQSTSKAISVIAKFKIIYFLEQKHYDVSTDYKTAITCETGSLNDNNNCSLISVFSSSDNALRIWNIQYKIKFNFNCNQLKHRNVI